MHTYFLYFIAAVLRQSGGLSAQAHHQALSRSLYNCGFQQITLNHMGTAESFSLVSKEPEVLLFVSYQTS